MIDFVAARRNMVEGQVRTADVTDLRILSAMLEIPRENFVPPALPVLRTSILIWPWARQDPAGCSNRWYLPN